jgi:hypothetical protein
MGKLHAFFSREANLWPSAGGAQWVTSPMVALGAESGGDGRRQKIEGRGGRESGV